MDAQEPSQAQVLQWIEAVRADLELLDEQLEPLLDRRRRLEARQSLLKDLLSSFEDGRTPTQEAGRRPAVSDHPPAGVGAYVRDQAREILRETGRPLHINELHAEFRRRGLRVPGAGKPVNLIVHLRKAQGIVCPARGIYGLEEHGAAGLAQRKSAKGRKRAPRRAVETEV